MNAALYRTRTYRQAPFGTAGFTLFELTVVIVIIAILLAVAINRLLPYIDEAERIAVLTTESQIRSGLVMAAAKRITNGRAASIVDFEGANPIALMLEPPGNYAGEFDHAAAARVPRRSWYFDTSSRHLVYRPGRPMALPDRAEPVESPEFEVRVAYADNDGDGTFEPFRDELHGIRLRRMAGFDWLGERAQASRN